MKNILIADAGSTNTEWALIDETGRILSSFKSEGINALLAPPDDITRLIHDVQSQLPTDQHIDEIYYYGAGCATDAICEKMVSSLHNVWPDTQIFVSSDLLGAARSLFGNKKGIACILGTGSNSCLYDGNKIASQIPSLGYILGDEGSGAALGKRLLGDAFKNQVPDNVREKFLQKFGLTLPDILDKIYRQSSPNAFLASLVPFLSENLWNPYIYSLVLEELTNFFRRNVAMYPGAHSIEVSFTGSIAFYFDKILREAAASQGYRVHEVSETPMEGLIEFHKTK